MATLDFGIIALALPRLAEEFNEPPDVIAWVALTHSLVVTGVTLTAGRAGDLFGRKRVYLAGYGVFTLGLCASYAQWFVTRNVCYRFIFKHVELIASIISWFQLCTFQAFCWPAHAFLQCQSWPRIWLP